MEGQESRPVTVFHLPHVTSTSLGHGFGSRNRAWPCTQTMAMFLILLRVTHSANNSSRNSAVRAGVVLKHRFGG